MSDSHQAVLTELLGQPIRALHPLSGGDICEAWRVDGAHGQTWFAKHHPYEPQGMFALEAQGLALLRETAPDVVQIPAVQVATPPGAPRAWLVLDWVPPGATTPAAGLNVVSPRPPLLDERSHTNEELREIGGSPQPPRTGSRPTPREGDALC